MSGLLAGESPLLQHGEHVNLCYMNVRPYLDSQKN